jgi:TupA-like ATPgrasp
MFTFRSTSKPSVLDRQLLRRPNFSRVRRIFKDYHRAFGRYPNLLRPKRFTEKMQWRKLFDRDPLFAVLSDKIAVREFIASRVGENLLPDLLWTGDDPDKIPFDALEPPYVVKCTHGSGFYSLMVISKESLETEVQRERFRNDLARNYGNIYCEPGYLPVPRRLMAERLLVQPDGSPPLEHKMLVFNGRVRIIQTNLVARNRTRYETYYDTDWNCLGWYSNIERYEHYLPRPDRLDDLIALGEHLGAGFDFIRVDSYDWAGGIRLGELTLYHQGGLVQLKPDEADFVLGSYWELKYPFLRAFLSTLQA